MASSSDPADDRLLASYDAGHRILLVGEGDFSFTEALSDQLPSGQAPLAPTAPSALSASASAAAVAPAAVRQPRPRLAFTLTRPYSPSPGCQIIASALDTEAELLQKYPAEIGARLAHLRARGVVFKLGVDATRVELHHLVDGARPAADSDEPLDSDEADATATGTVGSTLDRTAGVRLPRFDRVVYNFPYAHVTKFSPEFRQANLHLLRCFFARAAPMLAGGGEVHVRNKTSQPCATGGSNPG